MMASSISSSTAFPQGEAIRFTFSAKGRVLLGLTSSRIFVFDVASANVSVKHELKTLRRPLGATVLDDASLLAVVSSRHQANIYQLSAGEARHVQALTLDDTPRAVALSPTGGVLAVAYDDGIEVHALGTDVAAPQRRAVHCVGVDTLYFSTDETMLWGTSADFKQNDIVTITAPFYAEPETDLSPQDVQIRMWTTQVLFPSVVSGYSHACSIPAHDMEGGDNWVVAYDKRAKAFRAVRTRDAKAGIPYFAGPLSGNRPPSPASPVTIPTTDYDGDFVTIGSRDNGIWLYSMPENLVIPHSAEQALDEPLVNGHKIDGVPGITAACWVQPAADPSSPQQHDDEFCRRRLIAVAPGGLSNPTMGEEDVPIESGRVLILDFERSARNGEAREVSVEFGGESQSLLLKEHNPGIEAAVELERSRTLHQGGAMARRSATTRVAQPAANSQVSSSRGSMPYFNAQYHQSHSGGVASPRRSATATTGGARYGNPYHHRRFRVQRVHPRDNWVPPPPYTTELGGRLPDCVTGYYLDSASAVYRSTSNNNVVVRSQRTYAPPQRATIYETVPQTLVEGFDRLGVGGGGTQPLTQSQLQIHNLVTTHPTMTVNSAPPPPPRPLSYQHSASVFSQNPHQTQQQQQRLLSHSHHPHPQVASSHSYSISTPDLRAGQQNGGADPYRGVRPAIPITRRASTDPTHPVTLTDPTEEWRQRIENWNEQTIRANKKRSKLKCIVM